jgi:hypothetical protein
MFTSESWSEEERKILKSSANPYELRKALIDRGFPKRTISGIMNQMKKMGLKHNLDRESRGPEWTRTENQIIIQAVDNDEALERINTVGPYKRTMLALEHQITKEKLLPKRVKWLEAQQNATKEELIQQKIKDPMLGIGKKLDIAEQEDEIQPAIEEGEISSSFKHNGNLFIIEGSDMTIRVTKKTITFE